MTIAVGGNIGWAGSVRDQLLDTQTIMTGTLKFPVAVSRWNHDQPLYDSPSGLIEPGSKPVKIKVNYPLSNQGNAFVNDPTYRIADLTGNPLSGYTIDIYTGDITRSGTIVGTVLFRARDAGIMTEARMQIQTLSTVIGTMTDLIGMFQKQENAMLNSGAIS